MRKVKPVRISSKTVANAEVVTGSRPAVQDLLKPDYCTQESFQTNLNTYLA
jgi:hypothetical protein